MAKKKGSGKKSKKAKSTDDKTKTKKVEKVTYDFNTSSLAEEFGTTPRQLRMFLRRDFPQDDKFARYGWNEGDPELDKVREAWANRKTKSSKSDDEDEDDE